ncbi:MAG: MBL fold metallo-hydrolase [Candidatus Poseidoniales archaeon]|jgi:pyrroloquinoline quinone biosynthesis protein B|nr:MBL fold metallo-hydrolase [Candidatus Poseidoniales archaeon]|tara:strand:+ start:553 stop:1446 length:894 start_codon:yes stop_codon:yes gene_type:complete
MEPQVIVTILGTAQDAGIPQAGCSCDRCLKAHDYAELKKYPVSIGIQGVDGSKHLIEVTKNLSEQLRLWSGESSRNSVFIPDTVTITHLHLGHIEGIGQFGKPVMGLESLPIYLSEKNKELLGERNDIQLMEKEGNIKLFSNNYHKLFEPKEGCGFALQLIPIPHRNELGDTAAILIKGLKHNLLFMPDQDSWSKTLDNYSVNSIREFLALLEIDIAWIDGTFWNLEELPERILSEIPHPTIEESIHLLGMKNKEDPDISFIHLNHSNPVNDNDSRERKLVESAGWKLCERNETVSL